MKITFLLEHVKINGGNRCSLTYADHLSKMGHPVTILALTNGYFRRLIKNFFHIKVSWFKLSKVKVRWVADFKEDNLPNADIILATSWQTAGPIGLCSDKKGKKFHLIQHYESLYHGPKEEVQKIYSLPLRKIVISTWLKNLIKDEFGQESDLIVTPVDFDLFYPLIGLRDFESVKILMLHHTAKWKGVDIGLAAVENVRKKFPNLKLMLFGARKEEISIPFDDYYYNPSQKDLAKIYSSADIYLCPSEYEGLGMPAMEAMACKCALVTFDTGGSREYAFDGRTAFVAKHMDIEDLTHKLELAVSDEVLRRKIAEGGFQFIKNTFSWAAAAKKMENIFSDA